MHHFHYKKNELYCEDVPLAKIAAEVSTPCYVYSHATLTRHYQVFDKAFESLPHLICFAMKANSNIAVLRTFVKNGVKTIKIKLGKNAQEDVERVRLIRAAVSPSIGLRIDANQGWFFKEAVESLNAMADFDVQFCEQPIHHHYDYLLPGLRERSRVKIMADESVFNHYDAIRLIEAKAVDYINVKLAKSGGILEAIMIADTAQGYGIPCMLGGMLESRLALTAKAHLAMANDNFIFYDLDTCLLGQLEDPVLGGARYREFQIEITDEPGIAADIDPIFLKKCQGVMI